MNGENDKRFDVDDYVSKQLESYYGKDVVNDVSRSAPPPPPAHKPHRALSFAVVACAAVFLTGALMLAGVIFSGSIPTSSKPGVESSSPASSSASSNLSSLVSSAASTENSSAASSAVSSQAGSMISSEASSAVSSVVSSKASAAVSSRAEEENISEDTSAAESSGFSTSSEENVESHTESFGETSSAASWHIESYVLPETDDSSVYVIETEDRAGENGSITTGKRVRAGIGIFLMLASLGCAAALYNIYTDEEKTT